MDRDRYRKRETETEKKTEGERQTETEIQKEGDRQADRDIQRQKERQTDRDGGGGRPVCLCTHVVRVCVSGSVECSSAYLVVVCLLSQYLCVWLCL